MSAAVISDPTTLVVLLLVLLGVVFWLSTVKTLHKLFDIVPPVLWSYFVPMLLTSGGIIPDSSPVYDWTASFILPVSLFLLMLTVDLRAIARLGRTATIMMLSGTLGIIIGAPLTMLVFGPLLPPDAWKGLAALSGSWIGGTANMVAIQHSIGTPDSLMGPIIVVDTVVGYGWMGVLLALSSIQKWYDTRFNTRRESLDETTALLGELETIKKPVSISDIALILGLAAGFSYLGVTLGRWLPPVGNPTIISASTWAILFVVTAGLLLSFTPLRRMEEPGASRFGYFALYFLLTTIGAKANLAAVLDVPIFLVAGVFWIAIHISLMLLVARLIRAPLFFIATGSMANVGGAASAPIVASVYHPAMAPVGLLMAIAGYILGIYGGLLAAKLLAMVAGL